MIDKVLFVMEHYTDMIKSRGETTGIPFFVETLHDSGFVNEIKTFFYDDCAAEHGYLQLNKKLVFFCREYQPELIFFCPMGIPPEPAKETISSLRLIPAKMVMYRADSYGHDGDVYNQEWLPYVDYLMFHDSTIKNLGYTNIKQAIQGFFFTNRRYFYDRNIPRDLDVSFIGGINRQIERRPYIHYLRDAGIDVFSGGGGNRGGFGDYGDLLFSWNDYATLLSRSKISINFSGKVQFKSRVPEILSCKTFLLEEEGIQTKEFFEDGKDFVSFKTKEDLLEKVDYYLSHDVERESIATNGFRKIHDLYGSNNVWAHELNSIGYSVKGTKHYDALCKKFAELR
jgi:hypothetical protein